MLEREILDYRVVCQQRGVHYLDTARESDIQGKVVLINGKQYINNVDGKVFKNKNVIDYYLNGVIGSKFCRRIQVRWKWTRADLEQMMTGWEYV